MMTAGGGAGAFVVVAGEAVVGGAVLVVGGAAAIGVPCCPPLLGTRPQLVNVTVARTTPNAAATKRVHIKGPFRGCDVQATITPATLLPDPFQRRYGVSTQKHRVAPGVPVQDQYDHGAHPGGSKR